MPGHQVRPARAVATSIDDGCISRSDLRTACSSGRTQLKGQGPGLVNVLWVDAHKSLQHTFG